MDSITQAALGAGIHGAMLGKWQGRKALLYGAVLGTLPDLDVVIRYADPVSAMTHHRGFSHSLWVLTAVSIALVALIRRFKPDTAYSTTRLWLSVWLVLITHTLLDSFTSYGTQLWWPFMPTPASWSTVFIIDPMFTLPILLTIVATIIVGMRTSTVRALYVGLAVSVAYLGFAASAKTYIESRTRAALANQGIIWTSMFSAAAPLNTLLWRVMVKDETGHYYETITGLLDTQPPQFVKLPLNLHLRPLLHDSPEHARLQWFTGNWLRYDEIDNKLIVTDLRMGIAGHHFFRFNMAEHTHAGWQTVLPTSWQRDSGERQLRLLLRRAWDENTPIPLQEWAQQMHN